MKKLIGISLFTLVLAACGGGGGGDDSSAAPAAPTAPSTTAPGGLYLGYYQEDPSTNPEDPTTGAFSLNLPTGDGSFSGSMFFTFVGCQSSNVGTVRGLKKSTRVSGNWDGVIDGTAQGGAYQADWSDATQSYKGTYANANGKVHVDRLPCIAYDIAPNGTFEMFAAGTSTPSSFALAVAGRQFNWPATSGAGEILLYVLDPAIAQTNANPFVTQTLLSGTATSFVLAPSVSLVSGKEYIVAVSVGANGRRLAFGSRRFTAP